MVCSRPGPHPVQREAVGSEGPAEARWPGSQAGCVGGWGVFRPRARMPAWVRETQGLGGQSPPQSARGSYPSGRSPHS